MNGMRWNPDKIVELMRTNDAVLYNAILAMYSRQTTDEKQYKTASHKNHIGWNKYDALFMTDLASFLKEKKFLSKKQKSVALGKMEKYASQLSHLANNSTPAENRVPLFG